MRTKIDSDNNKDSPDLKQIPEGFALSPLLKQVLELRQWQDNFIIEPLPLNNSIVELAQRALEFDQSYRNNLSAIGQNIVAPITSIMEAQATMASLAKVLIEPPPWTIEMTRVNSAWLENISPAVTRMAELSTRLGDGLVALSNQMRIADALISKVDFSALDLATSLSQSVILKYGESFRNYLDNYADFIESLNTPAAILRFPQKILIESSKELVVTSYVTNLITAETDYTEESEPEILPSDAESKLILKDLLNKLNPDLNIPLQGAYDAINSRSIDKVRHATVSLRTLPGHILHSLAPDEKVNEWIPENPPIGFFDNGKLTINARLHYICKKQNNPKFNRLIESDAKSIRELISLLNDLHEINPEYTTMELKLVTLQPSDGKIWLGVFF